MSGRSELTPSTGRKRARMGGADKTPEGPTPPRKRSKPVTRTRTTLREYFKPAAAGKENKPDEVNRALGSHSCRFLLARTKRKAQRASFLALNLIILRRISKPVYSTGIFLNDTTSAFEAVIRQEVDAVPLDKTSHQQLSKSNGIGSSIPVATSTIERSEGPCKSIHRAIVACCDLESHVHFVLSRCHRHRKTVAGASCRCMSG